MSLEPHVLHHEEPLARLEELLRGRRWAALTGAGCSTESGIPDYRGLGARGRPRSSIQGPEFRRSADVRRRYWARATMGWGLLDKAQPNATHAGLSALEAAGRLNGLITQNVDRLHHRAGSRNVVELHGALAEVRCLECGVLHARDDVHAWLVEANRTWLAARAAEHPHVGPVLPAPDGDAQIDGPVLAEFRVVDCPRCDGVLKPNVVFFGDNVERALVDQAFAWVDEAEALVVAGTSLAVFSGYRFLLRAVARGIPVAIVNVGPVRGEDRAALKIEAKTGDVFARLAASLA